MAQSTKPKTGGDVVIHRESVQANMFDVTVANPAGGVANVPQVAGMPVAVSAGVATLVLATAEGTATHLLVHGPAISGLAASTNADGKYSAIGIAEAGAGGNITINETAVPANDARGAALTWATIKSTLGPLGFRFVTEPAKTTVQTT